MKLETLLRNWRKRMKDYNFTVTTDSSARARYEGIATGTRWCLEDLQKAIKGEKRGRRNRQNQVK